MQPVRRRFAAFAVAVVVLSLGSFYVGIHFVRTRALPPRHPLTGRQIAGIATDASWLDRSTREQEEGFTFDRVIPGLPRQHIIEFRK